MEHFGGFPNRMQFTSLPNLFFSRLLPQISDMAELKTTLYVLEALYHRRGYPRFVTYRELLANKGLMSALRQTAQPADQVLHQALQMATKRGTILHVALDKNGEDEDIYLLNTETDRLTAAKIQNGELHLPGLKSRREPYTETEQQSDLFTFYEQNIGMLTPLIADELKEAEKLYPEVWIRDAIKEAVNQNKRKWSYISAILERWSTEGKGDGAYRRDFKKADANKYIKGKYGHMVKY